VGECVSRRKITDYSEVRKVYLFIDIHILQLSKQIQYRRYTFILYIVCYNQNDDDGRQILLWGQRLQNQLADYLLTPASAIPSQWNYLNGIQQIIVKDKD
jgi:hypothetical protein